MNSAEDSTLGLSLRRTLLDSPFSFHIRISKCILRLRPRNIYVKTDVNSCANIGFMTRAKKDFDVERFFVALSDKTRLRLLNLMGEDEVCVCYFVEVLEEGQPKISRHLAYLRRAGIVGARREGKWIHYRVTRPAHAHAARVLDDVLSWLKEDREMQRDRANLVKVCCALCPPPQLVGAPKPTSLRDAA